MSAGPNLVVTLPEDAVELKAVVVPAPPAGESVTSLRDARGRAAGLLFAGSSRVTHSTDSLSQHRVRSHRRLERADEAPVARSSHLTEAVYKGGRVWETEYRHILPSVRTESRTAEGAKREMC